MNKPKQHHSISCASGAAFLYLIGNYIALVLVEFSHWLEKHNCFNYALIMHACKICQ